MSCSQPFALVQMPARAKFTQSRLQQAGEQSVAGAPLTSSERDVLSDLTCEYLGPHTEDGQSTAEATLQRDTLVDFQWSARVGVNVITRNVTTRCRHAASSSSGMQMNCFCFHL